MKEGNDAAAREKFGKSLSIKQAIGAKVGEAASFLNLGVIADNLQRTAEAAPLAAVGWLLVRSIGHAEAKGTFETLSGLCRKLGYDQTAFDTMLQRTAESFQKDRGRSLLRAAFPDWSD